MWNNRIVKHDEHGSVWYSVHEVFYNENGGINGFTEEPITILGETVEDVILQLQIIMKDIEKHGVIDASTVKFEDWYDDDADLLARPVKMDKTKKERLEKKGWSVGDADDFLNGESQG